MTGTSSFQKMSRGLVFLATTSVVAVAGYMLAGWDLVDSIYMVAITIFAVGYSEVRPIDDPGLKLFTMGVIVAGCSAGIYVVGGFIQMIAEGEIQLALGAKKMSRGIEQTKDHTIICGYGRVGQNLVKELQHLGIPFVVVDKDGERLLEAEAAGILVVIGDAAEETTLESAGIDRAAVLATVLPDDAANVFITLTARELNESIQIVARGESEATERKLRRSGANRVVMPAAIGASKIAHLIACPSVESLVGDARSFQRLRQDLEVVGLGMGEIPIPDGSDLVGCAVRDVELTGEGGVVVVALHRRSGEVLRNPPMDERIETGDVMIILSHKEELPAVSRRAAAPADRLVDRGTCN